jgi:hypothetical protein
MNSRSSTVDEPDSGYPRLETQIRWYDSKSQSAQWWYKRVKLGEFLCGAVVPVIASINGTATAIFGAVVIVLEGLQHLNQWHHNWITYRSTCEALRHEKYSYIGRSGVYDELDDVAAKKMLVERVEALVSTEHAKWTSRQEYESKKPSKSTTPNETGH